MKTTLCSIACSFLILVANSEAGDAVAVAYNRDGVWTAVTYYASSTSKGGRDYKTADEAREAALKDLKARAREDLARTEVIETSDFTGHFAVASGKPAQGKDVIVVARGASPGEAEKKAMGDLTEKGATVGQKVMYRYFSHGADEASAPKR